MTERPSQLGEEAAAWVVRLNSDQRTRADEAAFREWVAASPARAEAYAEHHALWAAFDGLAENEDARELLLPEGVETPVRTAWSRRRIMAGGAGAIAAAATAAFIVPRILNTDEYRTAPGEQKALHLADGSVVILNTASSLRVMLSKNERRLILDQGQAFFQVAKDKARPFRVFVGAYEVRALGTAFDVRRIGDDAKVTLEEGKVAIYHGDDGGLDQVESVKAVLDTNAKGAESPVAVLKPGQEAVMADIEPMTVEATDLRKAAAWRNGQIILDGSPLTEVVADLNRYGGPQIVLSDPRLNDIRVSGVFHTARPDVFVEAITAAFPVQVVEQSQDRIVLGYR